MQVRPAEFFPDDLLNIFWHFQEIFVWQSVASPLLNWWAKAHLYQLLL